MVSLFTRMVLKFSTSLTASSGLLSTTSRVERPARSLAFSAATWAARAAKVFSIRRAAVARPTA